MNCTRIQSNDSDIANDEVGTAEQSKNEPKNVADVIWLWHIVSIFSAK